MEAIGELSHYTLKHDVCHNQPYWVLLAFETEIVRLFIIICCWYVDLFIFFYIIMIIKSLQ